MLSSLLRGFMASILSSSPLAHMIDGAAADFLPRKALQLHRKLRIRPAKWSHKTAAAASARPDSHGPGIIPPGAVCNRNFSGELPLLDLWWH